MSSIQNTTWKVLSKIKNVFLSYDFVGKITFYKGQHLGCFLLVDTKLALSDIGRVLILTAIAEGGP